jgi:type IV secretory pathway protease TraF
LNRRNRVLFLQLLYLCLVGFAGLYVAHSQPYSLVWNRTSSIPIGLYLAEDTQGSLVHRGDLACFPYIAPDWAQSRRYFVEGLRLCKHVAGLPGDILQFKAGQWNLSTPQDESRVVGPLLPYDAHGRPLPTDALSDGPVHMGQLIMTAPPKNSLDSRYLGPIARTRITNKLYPIWTE